jgi:hypothetical protein
MMIGKWGAIHIPTFMMVNFIATYGPNHAPNTAINCYE